MHAAKPKLAKSFNSGERQEDEKEERQERSGWRREGASKAIKGVERQSRAVGGADLPQEEYEADTP